MVSCQNASMKGHSTPEEVSQRQKVGRFKSNATLSSTAQMDPAHTERDVASRKLTRATFAFTKSRIGTSAKERKKAAYHDRGKQSKSEKSSRGLHDSEDDDLEDSGYEYDWEDRMQRDYANSLNVKNRGGSKGRRIRKGKYVTREDFRNYSAEYNIKKKLMLAYDKTTRPVRNDTTTTVLYVGMSLYHILDTNEKFQTLSALIAVRLRWVDEYLTWNPTDYNDVDQIWLPSLHVWTPDIFINNLADDSFQDFMNTQVIVSSDGQVLWMFPAVVKTYCTLDVRHFPFDRQKCQIGFISWTFNGLKLNMTFNQSEHQAVYYTPKNQEWYVDEVTVDRNEMIYACCPEPYPDVTFTIHMTRRSLFYVINLIFPCLLIYAVSFLGFVLPVESGEKVNLEITILLALVVFLLIVGETLPPTPDAIPVLGALFGTTMIMVSIALVMSVIVTNIYLRKDSGKRVPAFLRKLTVKSQKHRKNSYSNKVVATENHVGEMRPQDIDLDNLSMLSEIDTMPCRSTSCSGNERRKSCSYRKAEDEKVAKIASEWEKLAKLVDKIFFWLFLFSSIGILVPLFATIPIHVHPLK